ncbi:uncharacterized protein LACBIDRAFT_322465 [Laccaria bicolor S238N-H82]|uniref:Predicted protein n=1 Tax=Laccaria bicolor (strain S238N-H82 / ATCC MYA-4686) TaxID=486041 RepID=B0CWD9_LACBS|nr:uncharacterized protein LACBIDRAFT_322465 [Laccaria bicolor S238N-H82]EDR13051.1 predicted protein [Laccaria bicolor S238N-H82]|eukprot:XP_001875549.1 predicted protein [Laccaria bicolor S238N-H82]
MKTWAASRHEYLDAMLLRPDEKIYHLNIEHSPSGKITPLRENTCNDGNTHSEAQAGSPDWIASTMPKSESMPTEFQCIKLIWLVVWPWALKLIGSTHIISDDTGLVLKYSNCYISDHNQQWWFQRKSATSWENQEPGRGERPVDLTKTSTMNKQADHDNFLNVSPVWQALLGVQSLGKYYEPSFTICQARNSKMETRGWKLVGRGNEEGILAGGSMETLQQQNAWQGCCGSREKLRSHHAW